MDRIYGRIALLAMCMSLAVSAAALGGNTYVTDLSPDQEVTEPDCYSFTISVDQASGSSATLSLRVHDVDEEQGELDEVYLNGTFLGYLSGTNNTWSTTTFDISAYDIYDRDNTIQVCVDPGVISPDTDSSTWVATIDWGQILVDGGSAEDAEITDVRASGEWNAIQVQTDIAASQADTYRLEINLLDSGDNNKDIATDTFTLSVGQSTTRTNTVSLPVEPSGGETFTVEALLFNETTGVQQNVMETSWSHASEPPTDLALAPDHTEENLPPLSAVGTLSPTDPDSSAHTYALIGGDVGSFLIDGDVLRTAVSFDYETRSSYTLQIQTTDEDENAYDEWFTIHVDDVNEPPVAVADAASVSEGSAVDIGVLDNDTDPESGELEVVAVSAPGQGTATIVSGSIRYAPGPGACGDDTFMYTVEDDGGETATGSVQVSIVNAPPVVSSDAAETPEGEAIVLDVLANDTDPGGGPLTLCAVSSPLHGTAVIAENAVRYVPDARFEGTDRFSYEACDSCGASAGGSIELTVLHVNHPPLADAGTFYQGVVGEPLTLDASFSHDPDVGDMLQYRWDLNGNGIPNTNWLGTPQYDAVYETPYVGSILVEVRDLYRGTPTGDVATATALVRIASVQSIQCYVYEDLDGDGVRGDGEPGVPGISVEIGGDSFITELDGGIGVSRTAGTWTVALPAAAVAQLESRGYAVPVAEASVELRSGAIETVTLGVVKTSTKLTGFVYVDLDGDGTYTEDVDGLLQGLRVVLDEQRETLTDDAGRFFFLSAPFGEHTLWIGELATAAEGSGGEDPIGVSVSVRLERTERTAFLVAWPWEVTGPEQGFLQVNVERSNDTD